MYNFTFHNVIGSSVKVSRLSYLPDKEGKAGYIQINLRSKVRYDKHLYEGEENPSFSTQLSIYSEDILPVLGSLSESLRELIDESVRKLLTKKEAAIEAIGD